MGALVCFFGGVFGQCGACVLLVCCATFRRLTAQQMAYGRTQIVRLGPPASLFFMAFFFMFPVLMLT